MSPSVSEYLWRSIITNIHQQKAHKNNGIQTSSEEDEYVGKKKTAFVHMHIYIGPKI